MFKINLALLGINLSFRTHNHELIDFIDIFSGIKTDKLSEGRPQIIVNFGSEKNLEIDKTINRISRNIWLGDSCIYLSDIERFPGLRIKAALKGDKLIIDANYKKKSSAIKRIFSNYRKSQQISLFYMGIVYYLIYFPFLYYMEHFRELYLLHAGAIKNKKNGIIFSGLGGIGKSTFIIGSLFMNSTKILSDNLIFYSKKRIFSFPEPVALNLDNNILKGDIEKILNRNNLVTTHGRSLYMPKPQVQCPKVTPTHLFLLQWGNENNVLPINKKELKSKLLLINLLAKELREYYILAAAFNLAFSIAISQDKYHDSLSSLLSNVDCYLLTFRPNTDLETVIDETLTKVIN